jgi:hypothetical protein
LVRPEIREIFAFVKGGLSHLDFADEVFDAILLNNRNRERCDPLRFRLFASPTAAFAS